MRVNQLCSPALSLLGVLNGGELERENDVSGVSSCSLVMIKHKKTVCFTLLLSNASQSQGEIKCEKKFPLSNRGSEFGTVTFVYYSHVKDD